MKAFAVTMTVLFVVSLLAFFTLIGVAIWTVDEGTATKLAHTASLAFGAAFLTGVAALISWEESR